MIDVICYDAQGYPLDFLTQWDLNRTAVLSGVELSPTPRVRFRNKFSATSVVVKAIVTDDHIRVDIPNILLTKASPIIIEVFYEYDDGSVATRYFFSVPVIPSKQPEDYTMEENIEYANWAETEANAIALMKKIEEERDWDVLVVDSVEPETTDVIWFNTSNFVQSVDGGV